MILKYVLILVKYADGTTQANIIKNTRIRMPAEYRKRHILDGIAAIMAFVKSYTYM